MFRKGNIVVILLLVCHIVFAGPARRGRILLNQPDGTSFYAIVKGDEFCKLLLSDDGCALVHSADGFYNYAYYDASGIKRNTGCHYGKGASPNIIMASKRIPYDLMAAVAEERRVEESIVTVSTRASMLSRIKAVIIPTEFSDLHFRYGDQDFSALVKDVSRYFSDQFAGRCDFEFVMAPVVTLPKPYSYYGMNGNKDKDEKAPEAVATACQLVDSSVNFAEFDNTGDGEVDIVFMLFAGPDEAEGAGDDYLWSHAWSLTGAGISLSLDGVRLSKYAASSELMYMDNSFNHFTGIGSFCHEFSHILGLKDLYDTDYEQSGGETEGVWGTTSLMDYGLYNNNKHTPPAFNAIEREMLGIADVRPLEEGEYELPPITSGGFILRYDTDNPEDYYLFECRQNAGWDKYAGGSGLLVYHVDRSSNDAGYSSLKKQNLTASDRWYYNEVNCNPEHMCAKVIVASEPFSISDVSAIFYPGANGRHTSMVPFESSFLSLDRIVKNDSGSVSFTVSGSLYVDNVDVYQDAAIFGWHLENNIDNPVSRIKIGAAGAQATEYQVASSGNNCYAVTVEGLKPKTEYSYIISVPDGKGGEYSYKSKFTTATVYSGTYPFIYLNRADRYISGAFKKGSKIPLRLYNASNVISVIWSFDGKRISVDPATGYFLLEKSGRLAAEIKYRDGSGEVMIKDVTVK